MANEDMQRRSKVMRENEDYKFYKTKIDAVKRLVDAYSKKIDYLESELKRVNSILKSAKTKADKDRFEKQKRDVKDKLFNVKRRLEFEKQGIQEYENIIAAQIISISTDDKTKNYIRYAEGKKYDENITRYNSELEKNDKAKNVLQEKDTDSQQQKQARADLTKKLEEIYSIRKVISDTEDRIKAEKDPSTKALYESIKNKKTSELNTKKTELKALYALVKGASKELKYDDFEKVIMDLPLVNSINEAFDKRKVSLESKRDNNKEALNTLLNKAREEGYKYTGYKNAEVSAPQITALVKNSHRGIGGFFWGIFHPIKYREEKKQLDAAIKEQDEIDSLNEFGADEFKAVGFRKGIEILNDTVDNNVKKELNRIQESRTQGSQEPER